MKKLLILFFIISNALNAQTIIRFKAIKSQINEEIGHIEQLGDNFIGKTTIDLSGKKINLTLSKSLIKNYKSIINSKGESSSEVDIYEDCTKNTKYFIATINKQFYSLFMLENGNLSSLEKSKNNTSIYLKNTIIDKAINEKIDIDLVQKIDLTNYRTNNVSGCFEFPIAFIVDYAQYKKYEGIEDGLAKLEADNLLQIAAVQELYAPYAFEAKISFKVIGQIVYTKIGIAPWSEDDIDINLGQLISYAATSLKKPLEWQKSKLLITLIITGIDYESHFIWGRAGSTQKEYEMGQAIIKGFLNKDQTLWTFAHELGHVFGASHDELNSSIMFPFWEGHGFNFSAKSKSEINVVLNSLNDNKWLKICPELLLNWNVANDSLVFLCQTNYDTSGDIFTLEFSEDKTQTWQKLAVIKSTENFKYQFTLPQKKEYISGIYFRVKQSGINEITSFNTYILITPTEENIKSIKPIVYLNNTNNQLIIKSLPSKNAKIYDINGRQILDFIITSPEQVIDINNWFTGIYIIKIEDNPIFTYKFIKIN